MVRAVKVVPLADDGGYGGAAAPRSFGGGGSTGGSGSKRGLMGGRVPSLVFDLEDLDAGGSQHPPAEPLDEASVAEVVAKLAALLEPWSEPEYMLLLHVRFAREDAASRGDTLTVPELADTLRRLGYAVKIRTALGGGSGGACLRSLRHSFLTVSVSGPSGSMSYVLDPRFRDQFEIAHTTPRYARVLAAVGPEVVSSQDRLNKVVEILCSEMARAFAETGTPLPPWRQHAAMLSKWSPRRSEEVDVTAALNNGAGLLLPPVPGAAAAQPGCGGGKRLTGPSTVAQRLMMLGVVQQSNPSPIAEGVEQVSSGEDSPGAGRDGWADGAADGASTSASSASSLHLDWDEHDASGSAGAGAPRHLATPQRPVPQRAGSGAAAAAAAQADLAQQHARAAQAAAAGRPVDVPQRTASDGRAIIAAAGNARGRAILEGMRAAAAALPHRRNNTWAG